ncbi:fibrinogen gamma [Acrasis kona]|uniref:Fibrinogen gamma n=1 Tax=Acrasis kona TaxID=1008807 RepID=A0AAW2ZJ35_9EUKA
MFDSLPDEIHDYIIQYLSEHELLICRSVSCAMRELSGQEYLWSRLCRSICRNKVKNRMVLEVENKKDESGGWMMLFFKIQQEFKRRQPLEDDISGTEWTFCSHRRNEFVGSISFTSNKRYVTYMVGTGIIDTGYWSVVDDFIVREGVQNYPNIKIWRRENDLGWEGEHSYAVFKCYEQGLSNTQLKEFYKEQFD